VRGLQSVPWADPPFSALLKQILNSATRYVIFVNFVPDFTKWNPEQMWLYTLSMMLLVLLAWLLLTCPVSERRIHSTADRITSSTSHFLP
jgi:hypothetical protein